MTTTSAITKCDKPSAAELLRMWTAVGIQSFGGGSATLALIRKAFVDSSGLVTPEEFSRDWGLVQIAPGINLFALTILIGRRTGGAAGIAVGLIGLLTPSIAATIVLTALYAHIAQVPWVHAALRGIVPATVGIGIAMGIQTLAPSASEAKREGVFPLLTCIAILLAAVLAERAAPTAVVFILIAGGLLGACETAIRLRRSESKSEGTQ